MTGIRPYPDKAAVEFSAKALRFVIAAVSERRDALYAINQNSGDEDEAAEAANDGIYLDLILRMMQSKYDEAWPGSAT